MIAGACRRSNQAALYLGVCQRRTQSVHFTLAAKALLLLSATRAGNSQELAPIQILNTKLKWSLEPTNQRAACPPLHF
jgi:hypothetical protein